MFSGSVCGQNPVIDGYVDIHTHLLPGIDDGAPDLDESLAMARAAVGSGTATIAATPHLHPNFPDVYASELGPRCEALREELGREQIPLEVVSGAEISLIWAVDATEEQLMRASYGQRGKDLLVESPLVQIGGIEQFVRALTQKGYRITLGHPERSPQFHRDLSPLRALVDQGVLLQLNADSLLGGDREAKRLAQDLLVSGLAHVLASDGHRASSWRPITRLAQALEVATELVGEDRARWMAEAAPAAVISGNKLPLPPPIQWRRKGRKLFRLG